MEDYPKYYLAFVNSVDEPFENFALFSSEKQMHETLESMAVELKGRGLHMYPHWRA